MTLPTVGLRFSIHSEGPWHWLGGCPPALKLGPQKARAGKVLALIMQKERWVHKEGVLSLTPQCIGGFLVGVSRLWGLNNSIWAFAPFAHWALAHGRQCRPGDKEPMEQDEAPHFPAPPGLRSRTL